MKFILLIIVAGFYSCKSFPDDPQNTLQNVTNGVLKVGYSENPPWVIDANDMAEGAEAELIHNFAEEYNAKIQWIKGTEQELFEKLEKKEIDLIIAGITTETPWKEKKISLTRPYLKEGKTKHVMAVKQGENRFQTALEKFLYAFHKQ